MPTCKLCLKKVRAAEGNTSNLRRHPKDHHPIESSKISKDERGNDDYQSQQTITDAFVKFQKYERGGKQWQKLTDLVTKCLAKDMMPIYTVEKSGFQQLLKDFDPKYQLPGSKYFSQQTIPKAKLYNETRGITLQ